MYEISESRSHVAGDTADSIPGVKSIGLKKATGLIREYGTLENLYANLDDMVRTSMLACIRGYGTVVDAGAAAIASAYVFF